MSICIERAKSQDAEELLRWMQVVGGETDNLTFGSEGMQISVEEEETYLSALSDSKKSAMFVAKIDGKIVGTASFQGMERARMSHRGSVAVAVKKSEWGKGIGRKLLETVIAFAKDEAGAEILSLEVRSDNKRAIRLYESLGFERIGQFRGFFKIADELVDFDLMNLYLKEEPMYLCQYSATGALFYNAYVGTKKRWHISADYFGCDSIVLMGDGERQFHSRYDLGNTLLPGMSRIIVDEQEQAIASLRWKGDSRYDLMYQTEVVAIEMQEDGFAAYKGRNLLLEAKKVPSKKQLQAYRKEEYDLEWAYRIRTYGAIADDLQMLLLAFPMLRFAY